MSRRLVPLFAACLCGCFPGGGHDFDITADASRTDTAPSAAAFDAHTTDDARVVDDAGIDAEPASARDVAPSDVDASVTDAAPPPACRLPPTELDAIALQRRGRFATVPAFPGLDGLAPRRVVTYLPIDYDADLATSYPVLYMHDGQNLFDHREASFGVEWQVDEILDRLVAEDHLPPHIVVGIDNAGEHRVDDYTPTIDLEYGGGGAERYERWLVEWLQPFVDQAFRTRCDREHTALIGSSLGGLVSLDTMMHYPEAFGRIGAVSPSLWWDGEMMLDRLAAFEGSAPVRLWLDAGGREGQGLDGGRTTTVEHVRTASLAWQTATGAVYGRDVGVLEVPSAEHNEAAWADRLPAILMFVLGDADHSVDAPAAVRVEPYDGRAGLTVGQRVDVAVTADYDDEGALAWPLDAAGIELEVVPVGAAELDGRALRVAQSEAFALTVSVHGVPSTVDFAPAAPTVDVTFQVVVPGGEGPVFVAGSDPSLGPWDPGLVELEPVDGGQFEVTVALTDQALVDYKYTRGSWETVEKAPDGSERPNRRALISGQSLIEDEVWRWAEPP